MPHYQAAGSEILHFGHGDIVVFTGRAGDSPKPYDDEIVFVVDQGTKPIGEFHEAMGRVLSDDINAPVRLIFDNVESLDVVIERLQTLRDGMGGAVQPLFAWTDMAASAYRAYAASTGNKNFRGDPMPAFEDLSVAIQTAWEAAVRHVGNAIEEPRALNARKEQSWQGWVRPQDKSAD